MWHSKMQTPSASARGSQFQVYDSLYKTVSVKRSRDDASVVVTLQYENDMAEHHPDTSISAVGFSVPHDTFMRNCDRITATVTYIVSRAKSAPLDGVSSEPMSTMVKTLVGPGVVCSDRDTISMRIDDRNPGRLYTCMGVFQHKVKMLYTLELRYDLLPGVDILQSKVSMRRTLRHNGDSNNSRFNVLKHARGSSMKSQSSPPRNVAQTDTKNEIPEEIDSDPDLDIEEDW